MHTDPEKVREILLQSIGNGSRAPFHELLADALENKPSADAWKELAEDKPDRYVHSVQGLARASGYADRTEHKVERRDIRETVTLIVNTKGRDAAQTMLESLGLPLTLLPNESPRDAITLDALPEPTETEISPPDGTQSP